MNFKLFFLYSHNPAQDPAFVINWMYCRVLQYTNLHLNNAQKSNKYQLNKANFFVWILGIKYKLKFGGRSKLMYNYFDIRGTKWP